MMASSDVLNCDPLTGDADSRGMSIEKRIEFLESFNGGRFLIGSLRKHAGLFVASRLEAIKENITLRFENTGSLADG